MRKTLILKSQKNIELIDICKMLRKCNANVLFFVKVPSTQTDGGHCIVDYNGTQRIIDTL